MLGPRGVPAPGDANGDRRPGRRAAPARSRRRRRRTRGGQVVRALGGASDGWFALGGDAALTNADLERARADVIDARTNEPIVALELTPSGQRAFAELTRRIAERGAANATPGSGLESVQHFVIVVDDRIASVPFIDFRQNPEGIDGATGMQISGDLTRESARQLAALLSAGPLPASFEPAGSGARGRRAPGRSCAGCTPPPQRRPPRGSRPARSGPSTAPTRGRATRSPGSAPSVARNASRLGPDSSVQAMTTSQAGSPTPEVPKSITAASRPSRSSRLPVATSPWNQTGIARPARRHRVLPHPQRGVAGDLVAERGDRAERSRPRRSRAVRRGRSCGGRAPAHRARRCPAARRGTRPGRSRTSPDRRCAGSLAISPSSQR